ncbi:MAG: hypothetical protein AAF960_23660 [Bacteroidota bacterium]
MDRPIRRKRYHQAPAWLINALKGVLLLTLCWNVHQHWPVEETDLISRARLPNSKLLPTPYIEEITFSELLSTTQPKINHFLEWSGHKIPYTDPELAGDDILYQHFSNQEFSKIWSDNYVLQYKGYALAPNKISALFIRPDSSFVTCEDEGNFQLCFFPTLKKMKGDFVLWLCIETEQGKTYFTRINAGKTPNNQYVAKEEAQRFWKKLINRDKHRSIDNLTVAPPVFKNNDYLFQWGDWTRYAHGPRGGRRVKLGINDFKRWANHQPYLYKNGEFVPFGMSVNFWRTKKKREYCRISRKTQNAPPIATNECFKSMTEDIAVGDILTIFIFIEGEFVKSLSDQSLHALPGFVVNDEYIQFSIPIEIVEEDFNRFHAPLDLTTSTFSFQLNSATGRAPIVKIDTNNPKNKALKNHYTESKSANIIHISDFKTVKRVITDDDIYVKEEDIDRTITLTGKVFKTETFPEFYDFNIQKPLIQFRGLSTVLDKTTYPLSDFTSNRKLFKMKIGEEAVKILQLTFTVIPKNGKATRYITNRLNRFDINKRLRNLAPETSLYFENILFERKNGEQLVFPLTTALHLQ